MTAVRLVRRVRFPASAIWPVLSDVVGFGEMAPELLRCELLEGDGVGLRRSSYDRQHRRWTEVCTAWDDGRGYTMHVDGGNYPYPFRNMSRRLEFEEHASGAEIALSYDYRPAWGPLGVLFNGVWQRHTLEPLGNALLDALVRRIRDRVWASTMTVRDLLAEKGHGVISVRPDTPVGETAELLSSKRIGAALVLNADEAIAGIVSERDIVRALADGGADALAQPVGRIMTQRVILCAPGDDMVSVMACMTERRIRHLPVVEDARLLGIISIGDVVKARMADLQAESEGMREYIASREWREHYMHGAADGANPFTGG